MVKWEVKYIERQECCGKPLKLIRNTFSKECLACGATYFSDEERRKHLKQIAEENKNTVLKKKFKHGNKIKYRERRK